MKPGSFQQRYHRPRAPMQQPRDRVLVSTEAQGVLRKKKQLEHSLQAASSQVSSPLTLFTKLPPLNSGSSQLVSYFCCNKLAQL